MKTYHQFSKALEYFFLIVQMISIKSYEPFVLEAIVIKDKQLKSTAWKQEPQSVVIKEYLN